MSVEIIIPIAAVIVLILIFTWLLNVLKASVKTMLAIAAILIVLQLAFGISSEQIIQQVLQIVSQIEQAIINATFRLRELIS